MFQAFCCHWHCRPEDPPVIQEVEVLWNPFDDIEPRTTREDRLAAAERWVPRPQRLTLNF